MNWQGEGSPLVLGTEFDGAWANIGHRATGSVGFVTLNAQTKLTTVGTLRAWVGWAADPLMIYGTGGPAFGTNELSGSLTSPFISMAVSDTQPQVGWTAQRAFRICSKVLVAAEFIVSNVCWATFAESSKSSLV